MIHSKKIASNENKISLALLCFGLGFIPLNLALGSSHLPLSKKIQSTIDHEESSQHKFSKMRECKSKESDSKKNSKKHSPMSDSKKKRVSKEDHENDHDDDDYDEGHHNHHHRDRSKDFHSKRTKKVPAAAPRPKPLVVKPPVRPVVSTPIITMPRVPTIPVTVNPTPNLPVPTSVTTNNNISTPVSNNSNPSSGSAIISGCPTQDGTMISVGNTIKGYSASTATYPSLCGQPVTRTCLQTGKFDGDLPNSKNCTQFCIDPDSQKGIIENSSFSFYRIESGSQSQCDSSKVTSICSPLTGLLVPSVPTTRFQTCTVSTPPTPSTNPVGSPIPISNIPSNTIQVLYIGNSLLGLDGSEFATAKGDSTPTLISNLAKADGKTILFDEAINFGATLQDTWNCNSSDCTRVQPLLNGNKKYDFIILQEYSSLVVDNPQAFYRDVIVTYQDALKKSLTSNGKVLLFKNYAIDVSYPFDNLKNRSEYIAAINSNYSQLSTQLLVPNIVVPVSDGVESIVSSGWNLTQNGPSQNYMIQSDQTHPSDASRYMTACMIYSIMYHRSPIGLSPLYFQQEAPFLQKAVESILKY